MKIKDRILKELSTNGDLSVKEMVDLLHVSKQAIHISITQLLETGEITKFGKSPKTIYRLKSLAEKQFTPAVIIDSSTAGFLNQNFLLINEIGEMKEGLEGFEIWCRQRKLPVEKTLAEFSKTKEKYSNYYTQLGIIDGTEKIVNTKGYEKIYLEKVYYLDFYAIERFGKTRLGTLLHYAKQGQNKFLMQKIVAEIKPALQNYWLQKSLMQQVMCRQPYAGKCRL